MAHARRKFFDLHATNKSQIAEKALHYIAALYEVEREVRELEPGDRQRIRQEKATLLRSYRSSPPKPVDDISQLGNATPSLHSHYKNFITTTNGSAPRPLHRYSSLRCWPLVISLGIKGKVLTFHIKACIELMPPIHRLPSGQ
jgi:hypothetical protein